MYRTVTPPSQLAGGIALLTALVLTFATRARLYCNALLVYCSYCN